MFAHPLLVVDDEEDGGHWLVRLFSLLISLIILHKGKLVEQGTLVQVLLVKHLQKLS